MKKILISLFALFYAVNAYAVPTCKETLGINFTPNQKEAICKVAGTAVAGSLIPNADNTYDLGSTNFFWRNLYYGGTRYSLTSDVVRLRTDANRLMTWDATTDTAFSQKWGDGSTAAQTFAITSADADASDDSILYLSGGGTAGVTRGGHIQLSGNESGGIGGVTITAGTIAGAAVNMYSDASNGNFTFSTNGSIRWTIESDGDIAGSATGGDVILAKSGATLSIQEATGATACMGLATPNGVTNVTVTTSCGSGGRVFYSRAGAITNMGTISTTASPNGTNFTFASTAAADTLASSVVWWIIKESA